MVYATKYMQRSKVIAFEYIQIMKPPISRERERERERERIVEIRQYKTMCGEMQK
jgi:hypothetical protein